MWMGFACGSLLSEYPLPGSTAVRFWQRIAGAAAGCAAFALLYLARPSAFVSPRCSTGCRAAFCPRRTQPSEPKHKTKTGAPLLAVRRFFCLFSEPCSRTLDYRGFLMAACTAMQERGAVPNTSLIVSDITKEIAKQEKSFIQFWSRYKISFISKTRSI